MNRAKIVLEELKEEANLFLAMHIETKNSSIILLSEGEDQIGTLAVAIPRIEKMSGEPLSSILLGDRNSLTSRLLAERLAQRTGKISLTSVFAKTINEQQASKVFFKLFEKILKEKDEGVQEK